METKTQETSLTLTRIIHAPKEELYRAWTQPEVLKQWCAPSDEFENTIVEVDLRVGGAYRIGMHHRPTGKVHMARGRYREIRPNEKLVFTWAWEDPSQDGPGETLVTIEFLDRGGKTELRLTHELFPDRAARDNHEQGWTGCVTRLTNLFL